MSASVNEQVLEQGVEVEVAGHEDPSTQTILFNVAAQIINLAIFLFIFVKFFGGKIKKQLHDRQKDIEAIASAKEEYTDIIAKAQKEVDQMIMEGKTHKEKLFQEGVLLGKKKEEEIISHAQNKADMLISQAQGAADRMTQELQDNFVSSVKHVSKLVIKKVAGDHESFQDAYLEKVAKEFSSHK